MNKNEAFINEAIEQQKMNDKLDDALIYFRLWYEFLKLNDEYRVYCELIKSRKSINTKHELSQVYANWGDIFEDCTNFRKWRFKHRDNIIAYTQVKETINGVSLVKDLDSTDTTRERYSFLLDNYFNFRPAKQRMSQKVYRRKMKCLAIAQLDKANIKLSYTAIHGLYEEFEWLDFINDEDVGNIVENEDIDDIQVIELTKEAKAIIRNTSFGRFPCTK